MILHFATFWPGPPNGRVRHVSESAPTHKLHFGWGTRRDRDRAPYDDVSLLF